MKFDNQSEELIFNEIAYQRMLEELLGYSKSPHRDSIKEKPMEASDNNNPTSLIEDNVLIEEGIAWLP